MSELFNSRYTRTIFLAVGLGMACYVLAEDVRLYSSVDPTVTATPLKKAPDAQARAEASWQEDFAAARPPIRAFLLKAQDADKIEDPLARCLQMPDLPDNHWPAGLAQAHCQFVHGPRITREQVAGLVQRGAFAELDKRFAADLNRHFSDQEFSEVIHRDYDAFDSSYEAGRDSKIWLEKAPRSAFALAARGVFYRAQAKAARGTASADATPPENFARMHEYADKAVEMYRGALRIEPRLMPAYTGLIDLGTLDSRDELRAEGFAGAHRADPDCISVNLYLMRSLQPRWGGSYAAMRELATAMASHVDRRPLLALLTHAAEVEAGKQLVRDSEFSSAVATLVPVLGKTTDPDALQYSAISQQSLEQGDKWLALMYLMEASRFADNINLNTNLGHLLINFPHRLDWGVKFLKRASDENPDDGQAHMELGIAYRMLNDIVRADEEFRLAARDPEQHTAALEYLVSQLQYEKKWKEALEFSDALIQVDPSSATAWQTRYELLKAMQDPRAPEALRKFFAVVNRSNATERAIAEAYERQLANAQKQTPPRP